MVTGGKKKEFGGIEKRGRKERKKERRKRKEEKKKRKKREEVPTLQDEGFFSYLGYLCLGAIPWPWSLAPTLGLVQNNLEQIVMHF